MQHLHTQVCQSHIQRRFNFVERRARMLMPPFFHRMDHFVTSVGNALQVLRA